jgi:hypothetical protein
MKKREKQEAKVTRACCGTLEEEDYEEIGCRSAEPVRVE